MGRCRVIGLVATLALLLPLGAIAPASAGTAEPEGVDGKLVFNRGLSVYTMNLDGSDPVLVLPQIGADFGSDARWSPGGTQIALSFGGEVQVMNPDGSNRHRVSPDGEFAAGPTWSPDGQRIAWASGGRIRVADADGTHLSTIERPTTPEFDLGWKSPDWSPDGTEFVGTVVKSGVIPSENRIAVVPVGGGEPSYLTAGPFDVSPHWSPDGTQVAYRGSDTLDAAEIRVMSSGGGGAQPITPSSRYFRISDWAASGTIYGWEEILPADSSSKDRYIYRVNPDGSDLAQVPNISGDNAGGADWASTACSTHPFNDVPAWVDAAVVWAWCNQYLAGFGNRFEPADDMTRAQVARFLYRVAGSPDVSGLSHGLSDVPAWVDDAVRWLVGEGHATGYGDMTFRPDVPITRAAVTRMQFRIAGSPPGSPSNPFADVPGWVADAVDWIVDNEFATGFATVPPTFEPLADINRAQTTRMTCRINTDPGNC